MYLRAARHESPGRFCLKYHNSPSDMIAFPQNLFSMAQNRTEISFGDRNHGFQVGIHNGPIHLPLRGQVNISGTSVREGAEAFAGINLGSIYFADTEDRQSQSTKTLHSLSVGSYSQGHSDRNLRSGSHRVSKRFLPHRSPCRSRKPYKHERDEGRWHLRMD